MKTFQSKNTSQSAFLKPSLSYQRNVSTLTPDNKENYYKFSNTASNSSIRKSIMSTETINTWETSLDKELNKILLETLNGPNKENQHIKLVDHTIRNLKQLYDEQEVLGDKTLLENDIRELLNLSIPTIEVETASVGNFSLPQFFKLVETNHLLNVKISEIQKAINIYNIRKSIIIDRILERLENPNLEQNQETSKGSNQNISKDLQELFTTNRITKQEKLDDINENLSLCDTLQSCSDSNYC